MNNNLKYKNTFNTYQRFTDQNGLQQYKNGIGIDHYLGAEVLELKPKEIETLIAYNEGEMWWSEVEPATASDRDRIAKAMAGYNDWHYPNAEAIKLLNPYWQKFRAEHYKWYSLPKRTCQITITIPLHLEKREEMDNYVKKTLDKLL